MVRFISIDPFVRSSSLLLETGDSLALRKSRRMNHKVWSRREGHGRCSISNFLSVSKSLPSDARWKSLKMHRKTLHMKVALP